MGNKSFIIDVGRRNSPVEILYGRGSITVRLSRRLSGRVLLANVDELADRASVYREECAECLQQ